MWKARVRRTWEIVCCMHIVTHIAMYVQQPAISSWWARCIANLFKTDVMCITKVHIRNVNAEHATIAVQFAFGYSCSAFSSISMNYTNQWSCTHTHTTPMMTIIKRTYWINYVSFTITRAQTLEINAKRGVVCSCISSSSIHFGTSAFQGVGCGFRSHHSYCVQITKKNRCPHHRNETHTNFISEALSRNQ